jgi:uncharacterized delta-60 repeat protein
MKLEARGLLALATIMFIVGERVAAAPGDLDALNANILGSAGSYVFATALQPDGKIIIGGFFTSVQGMPRTNIARLNPDGNLDASFDPNADSAVYSVAVQPDGKLLLGGQFTTLQPNGAVSSTARQYIARLEADGTLDMGFDPKPNNIVRSVALQSDGKVFLGGSFTTLQPNGAASPTTRNRIARVNPTGTLDPGFDPRPNSDVYSITVQTDGKVLVGGTFNTLHPNGVGSPTSRVCIARVNATGTLDTVFNPRANNFVWTTAVQPDGKIILGGFFTTLQPNGAPSATTRNRIARVHGDGTLDTAFNPNADAAVITVGLQTDGKVLLGGLFTTLQPNGAASPTTTLAATRIHADGTLDTAFDPRANFAVYSVAIQADGKVLLGGGFDSLQPHGAPSPITRRYFARLLNDAATQTLSAPDSTQVLWQRSGAAPEVARVTLELSTDGGGSWALLGSGTRVGATPNWQLTGLTLPASGSLRARGFPTDGRRAGIIETVTPFTFGSPDTDGDGLRDAWELTYWATLSLRDADDDSDYDGLPELQELAFGRNPALPDSALAPQPIAEGGYLAITLTKQPGVLYEVQTGGTLRSGQPDSFSAATTTVLMDDPGTLKVRDHFPIGAATARFLRIKVIAAP